MAHGSRQGSLGLRATTSGILGTGPIEIPVSAGYTSPQLATAGYANATLVPSSVTGGPLSSVSTRQLVQGVLAYINNAGNAVPPGMNNVNYSIGFLEPINDRIAGLWTNGTTAVVTLGDILYSMTS